MTIELFDIDVTYTVGIDTNSEGKDFIRISPNSSMRNRSEDYDICLDKTDCIELIRVLTFVKNEIK